MPNWLVERLAKLRLNGTQWQILWAIWRRTLCWQQPGGWGNRPYPTGIEDLVSATDLNEYQVKRETSQLVKMNIILRESTRGRGHKPLTAFNLDPSTWKVPQKGSEIATLSQRVAEEQPFATQKGSETATPIPEGFEKKGSGNATPWVADSLPFTNRSATFSEAKSKLPKKTLKKHYKETYIVVFDHWNSLGIIKHKKMTDRMRSAL
jgi:phage replication O-like protein O